LRKGRATLEWVACLSHSRFEGLAPAGHE